MHDEPLDDATDRFVADLAVFRTMPVPAPGADLRALFASTTVAATPATRARRTSGYRRLVATLPSKVAAGVFGALLAGTVGAGALTGTMTLTADEGDEGIPVLTEHAPIDEDTPAVGDGDGAGAGTAAGAESEEEPAEEEGAVEAEAPKEDLDLTGATAPTSVSHAARIHAFDEACGDHGAYVSAFAETGAEPDCAVAFRASGGLADAAAAEAAPDGADDGAGAGSGRAVKGQDAGKGRDAGRGQDAGKGRDARKGKDAGNGRGAERPKADRDPAAERKPAKG